MSFEKGGDLFQCAQIVERGDPDRFWAAMAAPVTARKALFPIYAFNVEVSRAPWVTQEPMIAQMRLQWWWDALEEIRLGQGARRHEIVTPLAQAINADAASYLQDLVEARRLDIERAPFEDEDAFWTYLEATGGHLAQAAALSLGDRDGRAATLFGTASALAAYFRAIPELEARGKVPLHDGRVETLATLAVQGLGKLRQAKAHVGDMPKSARPALAACVATKPILKLVVQSPGRVAEGALTPSEAQLRFVRLWGGLTGRW